MAQESIDISTFFDGRKVGGVQLAVVALCSLVVLLDGLDTQVIGYLGPALSKEWHLSRAALGPVFSASLVGLMAGLLTIGPLADKRGRRMAIIASTLLFGVFTLLTAGARGVTDLFIYRFIAGIGLGGAMPNALALTGEYCPTRRRATLVVLMFCGFSLGGILGGGLTAALIAQYGWRSIFLASGAIPVLLVPVLMKWLPESLQFLALQKRAPAIITAGLRRVDPAFDPPHGVRYHVGSQRPQKLPVADLFRDGRAAGTIMLWVVFFMNLLDFFFLQSWLPTIFTDSGLPIEQAVLMSTLISVGGIVAGLMSGPLMDRFGSFFILTGLYVFGTLFVALIGVAPPGLLAIATFFAGFCVSGAQKSVNAAAVIFYPTEARSTGVGWALGIGRVGSIIGPSVGGALLALGWKTAELFRLAALPMAVAAVVMLFMGIRYGSKQ